MGSFTSENAALTERTASAGGWYSASLGGPRYHGPPQKGHRHALFAGLREMRFDRRATVRGKHAPYKINPFPLFKMPDHWSSSFTDKGQEPVALI